MRTYIHTETGSTMRDCNICITVWRIKQNMPHFVGYADHHTKSWTGRRATACEIIHNEDHIPYGTHRNGTPDRYTLRGLLSFADLYTTTSGDGIRLFAV